MAVARPRSTSSLGRDSSSTRLSLLTQWLGDVGLQHNSIALSRVRYVACRLLRLLGAAQALPFVRDLLDPARFARLSFEH